MKVAHLARKPLEGTVASNTLEHGTGSINIDGCRIVTKDDFDGVEGFAVQKLNKRRKGESEEDWRSRAKNNPGQQAALAKLKSLGRWPANLILVHKPGCKPSGTRKSSGYAINRWVDGAKPFGGGAGHEYSTVKTPETTEIVWDCVSGCPALSLDEQSGGRTGDKGASRFFLQTWMKSKKST